MSYVQFKNQAEIETYAQRNNLTLVIYDDHVLDVTSFAPHHPGGSGLIKRYQNKDISKQMDGHFPLSLVMANTMSIGSIRKDIEKIIKPDEPLMRQIWDLDHTTYLKIVDSPHWLFVPSPRMFETDFMEMLSHNKWHTIIPLPLLCVIYMAYNTDWAGAAASLLSLLITAVLGFLAFTLTEYSIHRWIFHSEKHLFDNRLLRYLHYVLHGIHHMLPNDPDRLVYPPALALATAGIGLLTVVPLIPVHGMFYTVFWGAFLAGYVTYDITHYCLHHIDTTDSKQSYLHKLQAYHNQHHFSGEEAGYGVSSKLWDVILGTGFKGLAKHG